MSALSKGDLLACCGKLGLATLGVAARGLDGLVPEELGEADEVIVVGSKVFGRKGVAQSVFVPFAMR